MATHTEHSKKDGDPRFWALLEGVLAMSPGERRGLLAEFEQAPPDALEFLTELVRYAAQRDTERLEALRRLAGLCEMPEREAAIALLAPRDELARALAHFNPGIFGDGPIEWTDELERRHRDYLGFVIRVHRGEEEHPLYRLFIEIVKHLRSDPDPNRRREYAGFLRGLHLGPSPDAAAVLEIVAQWVEVGAD
jgi:hypothetical protein